MENKEDSSVLKNHFNIDSMKNIKDMSEILNLFNSIEKVYFTNYTTERNELLKSQIMSLLKIIDTNLQNGSQLSKDEISFLYFVKSLSLDKLPEYSKESEESASKSLKLNPFIADNFNCIAHIMWKKPDIEQAIKYFEKALALDDKNKTSLRSLSMIIRTKEANTQEEKSDIARQSLEYAKKAIKLDMQDSSSWYVYGNAYFYKAFIDQTQYNDLSMALSAYNKSQEKDIKYKNPDLYYNRGVVHAYLENYEKAYNDFMEANAIDKNLKSDQICQNITETVSTINKLVKNQCGLKPKNLAQIVASIPCQLKEDVDFVLSSVRNLKEGENKKKIITGKIIQSAQSCFEVPICLVCVDFEGEFLGLSLFNISKEFLGTIKYKSSSFIVLNPFLKMIKMKNQKEKDGGKDFEYPCIQVNDLQSFLVDGKYCSGFASSATLNSTFFN